MWGCSHKYDILLEQTLRQCLQQVADKEQTDSADGSDSLTKIQAMLDTTKVQVELRKALEEKELLSKDLQELLAMVTQLRGRCVCVVSAV